MDVSKIQQKYKHYTCLCFSVMGQKRFRISMGALIAPPEAGDASFIRPQKIKYSTLSADHLKNYNSTMSEKNTTNQYVFTSSLNSNSLDVISKDEFDQLTLMNDHVFNEMSTSTIHDICQFPYYRSTKSNGRFSDAVLVKDVGVSCVLLKNNTDDIAIPETKNFLLKQLKKEYNDLSTITNKITAYTKDILNHLSKKTQRKVPSKHAIASQYRNREGNVCLKLRLVSNSETQCTPQQILQECNSTEVENKHSPKQLYTKHSKNRLIHKDHLMREKRRKVKYEKEVQTKFSKEKVETTTSNSLSHSTSSVYNCLMMKKRKSSKELVKLDDVNKQRNHKNYSENKNFEDHLKRCSPVIFTNWREISKSKRSNNRILCSNFHESKKMTNIQEKHVQKQIHTCNAINKKSDKEFHTVNIRIIQRSEKHT